MHVCEYPSYKTYTKRYSVFCRDSATVILYDTLLKLTEFR